MAEYKDVEKLKKRVREDCNGCWNRNSPSKCPDDCGVIETIKLLDSVPTVDAVPVRNGRWKRKIVDCGFNADWVCSQCGHRVMTDFVNYKFCPHCGARMDGERHG